jgi:hypothetical protein
MAKATLLAENKSTLAGVDVMRYLNTAGACFVLPKDIDLQGGDKFQKGEKVAVRIDAEKKVMYFERGSLRSESYRVECFDAVGKKLLPHIDDFFQRDVKLVVKVYGSEKTEQIIRNTCLADIYDRMEAIKKENSHSRGFSIWVGYDMDFN